MTDPSHPRRSYHELRVQRIIRETDDARSFVLEIPEELCEIFAYEAGQFLTFEIPYQGKKLVRCYSLASSPDSEGEWKVTVKRVDDGRISNWFNDALSGGETLRVLPPQGLFTLRPGERPLLLFAGGSGITPVISLIKSALVTTGRRIRLVYANRDRDSIIFGDELDDLVERGTGRLELIHSLDTDSGLLTAADVERHTAGFAEADFYICGPEEMMDLVESSLGRLGVPADRIFIERFESPPDHHLPSDEEIAQAAAAEGSHDVPQRIAVLLEGTTHEVPYTPGETILQAAQRAGLAPPFSCEDGYCSCCMAKLQGGEVKMRKNDCLTEREIGDGWVLTCQSVPQTRTCRVSWDEA